MYNGVYSGYFESPGQTQGTFCGKMRVETTVSNRDFAYFRLYLFLFLFFRFFSAGFCCQELIVLYL